MAGGLAIFPIPPPPESCPSKGTRLFGSWNRCPRFKEFEKQDEEIDKAETQSLDLRRPWVKTQRFIRTAETVALAANLPKVAAPEIVKRYLQIVQLEGMALHG